MAKRTGLHGFGQLIEITPQCEPGDDENRQRSQDNGAEEQGDELWRRLRIVAEDVMDLGLLAETLCLRQRCLCGSCISLQIEFESWRLVRGGPAERANNDGRSQRSFIRQKLRRHVFKCKVDFALARLFHRKWEACLETAGVLDGQERLVWALGRLALLCRKDDLECIGGTEIDCAR